MDLFSGYAIQIPENNKDVLIYRQEYRLSELDRLFMKEVFCQRDALFAEELEFTEP